jgi:hypothetical protein
MLDALDEHLRTSASPELHAAVMEACDWFEKYSVVEWQDRYTELFMLLDNAELSDSVIAISDLTFNLQKVLLTQFQIEVNEDVRISTLNLILRALSEVEATELAQDISYICSEEGDCVEIFSAVLHQLTVYPAEDFHQAIKSVSRALIDKIKEVCDKQIVDEDQPIDLEKDKKTVSQLRSLLKMANTDSVLVYNLIKDGMRLNMPFKDYYDKIITYIPSKEPDRAALEVLSACLVSQDASEKPLEIAMESLSRTFSNIDELTPIQISLSNLILKFESVKNSNMNGVPNA